MEIDKMTESQSPKHTPDSNPEEVEDSSHSSRDGSVDVHMQEAVGGVQPTCQPLLIPGHQLFMSYQVSASQCFGEPYGNSLPQLHSAETPHSTSASDGSKSPPPPRQYKPCVVCQDKSSGYHYGVSSCEGCKGFFRRSVTKNMAYECHKAGNCVVNKVTRNRCQACRFDKCLAKGMTREAVRNGQHNKKKGKQRPESTSSNNDQLTEEERSLIDTVCLAAATSPQDGSLDSPSTAVRDALRNGEKFQLWEETYELSSRAIVDIVNFAKKVPNFLSFPVADQITLLKASCLEIMVLRLCKTYDAGTDEIVLRNFRLNERQINIGGMDTLAPTIFRLAKKMHALNLDEREFAMVSAICLISGDRSGLTGVQAVEQLRDQLSEALKHYMRQRRSPQCKEFPSVLVNLMDLRSISVQGLCTSELIRHAAMVKDILIRKKAIVSDDLLPSIGARISRPRQKSRGTTKRTPPRGRRSKPSPQEAEEGISSATFDGIFQCWFSQRGWAAFRTPAQQQCPPQAPPSMPIVQAPPLMPDAQANHWVEMDVSEPQGSYLDLLMADDVQFLPVAERDPVLERAVGLNISDVGLDIIAAVGLVGSNF